MAMRLVSELHSHLSISLETWDAFIGRGGDHEYFLDMRAKDALLAFDSIEERFRQMKESQAQLNTLRTYCHEAATTVSPSTRPRYNYICAQADVYMFKVQSLYCPPKQANQS